MKTVVLQSAPISERMWYVGQPAQIQGDKIRVGGNWFDLDDRWKYTECKLEGWGNVFDAAHLLTLFMLHNATNMLNQAGDLTGLPEEEKKNMKRISEIVLELHEMARGKDIKSNVN